MNINQIRKTIENDYNSLAQVKNNSRVSNFYLNFSRALEELHVAVSPFITSTDQFIDQIKYLRRKGVPKEVYSAIITYCKDKFNLEIK